MTSTQIKVSLYLLVILVLLHKFRLCLDGVKGFLLVVGLGVADDGDGVAAVVDLALELVVGPIVHVLMDLFGEGLFDFAGGFGFVAALAIGAAFLVVARVGQLVVGGKSAGGEEEDAERGDLHGELRI